MYGTGEGNQGRLFRALHNTERILDFIFYGMQSPPSKLHVKHSKITQITFVPKEPNWEDRGFVTPEKMDARAHHSLCIDGK